MWLLEVDGRNRTTRLTKDGILISVTCYTGAFNSEDETKNGYNNPALDYLSCVGPLPEGMYIIEGPPYDDEKLGKYVLKLNPYSSNEMYGRSAFRIHGKPLPPKDIRKGSDGCLCADHDVRMKIYQSGDIILQVKYIQVDPQISSTQT